MFYIFIICVIFNFNFLQFNILQFRVQISPLKSYSVDLTTVPYIRHDIIWPGASFVQLLSLIMGHWGPKHVKVLYITTLNYVQFVGLILAIISQCTNGK
jgi:hypothetical protein